MAPTEWVLGVAVWIFSIVLVSSQYSPSFPSPYLRREIFILNLEDGYFGCQVNESTDVLQLFELSKLCDNVPHCFHGSDEVASELKCTDKNFCHPKMPRCINGVCLENLCYCNDGFGGKGCEMPDENECKYRPCDVFGHCTNTMGSFYCSCFPGYEGDGFECHDINECEIPSLASICVPNSECCNLPGHYKCKCSPGYTGNATVACLDIDECLDETSCGRGAHCENIPGSYRCFCPTGFDGDPFIECLDVDECRRNPCGPGALCENTRGGYTCNCPFGYVGNPRPEIACIDINECLDSHFPCGKNAKCENTNGGFYCVCPEGYSGNAKQLCNDINECPHSCGANTECSNLPGSYKCLCKPGYDGDPYLSAGCHDVDECLRRDACGLNAECHNLHGSYECVCKEGYSGDPRILCADIDECIRFSPCAENSECYNIPGSYECKCLEGYDGNGRESCNRAQVEVRCHGNHECTENAECHLSRCRCKNGFQVNGIECVDVDECRTPHICGRNANCRNTFGNYLCECKTGYEKIKSSPQSPCRDINECLFGHFPCGNNAKCVNNDGAYDCLCPDNLIGDAKVACKSPCEGVDCGPHAECQANGQEAACICNLGYTFDPNNINAGCLDINECEVSHGPSGLCGVGAICTNVPGSYHCYCPPGFTGEPFKYCEDVNECDILFGSNGQCGTRAICTNSIGSFSCSCPPGYTGNGRVKCQDINECSQAYGPYGKCGLGANCINKPGGFDCKCPPGTEGDPYSSCTQRIICINDNTCPGKSICDNRRQCHCPYPFYGDQCADPCDEIFCGDHAKCQLDPSGKPVCVCSPGFTGRSNSLPGCVDINECTSDGPSPCGENALCRNLQGSFECSCPRGFSGDAYKGCLEIEVQVTCSESRPCPLNEECVTVGRTPQCVCKRGYTRDLDSNRCRDINECTEYRNKQSCGLHAFCTNLEGSYVCHCPPGHAGNPYSVCYPDIIQCRKDNECPGNTKCLLENRREGHCGCTPPFVQEGEYCILVSRNCSTTHPCPENQECVFTGPSYGFCICPRGYTVEADGFCRDINECTEIKEWTVCGAYTECVNLPGSYECICSPGYTGVPRKGCTLIEIRCHGNDCPPNQKCIHGQCQCLQPFVLEGQTCKNPCDLQQCGQYAECHLLPEGPQCQCIKGCTGNPNKGCYDINECVADLPIDPNGPCAVGAVCINIVGGFQCECSPGTNGDPYESGCRGAPGCTSNNECPHNALCDTKGGTCIDPCSTTWCSPNTQCFAENHKAVCKCLPGYVGNPNDLEKGCTSPCSGVWCAVNAHCIVNSANQGTCHCLEGFTGNPWAGGGCHPDRGCTSTSSCRPSQECLDGVCVERCDGVQCGVGARCDGRIGQCICLPFFIGNPQILCVPPILPPLCLPSCGVNAHCVYSVPNRCVCNPGYSGNPYKLCGTERRCDNTDCGNNANCVEGPRRVDCVCPAGLQGNPYISCRDVNECVGSNPCGTGASCINSVGSYLCACPPGRTGNPLFACTEIRCQAGQRCACRNDNACPGGEACRSGQCVALCESVVCGPNAFCEGGSCHCPTGMFGEPSNPGIGCSPPTVSPNLCEENSACPGNSACRQNNEGFNECIDVCSNVHCGPNAQCIGRNHQYFCECVPGYSGNPNDIHGGCTVIRLDRCTSSIDCPDTHVCVTIRGGDGYKECVHVCEEKQCGTNSECTGRNHRLICECAPGFTGNPYDVHGGCELPPRDICNHDSDCDGNEICRPVESGVKDCVGVCNQHICGVNAHCIGKLHRPICECRNGFFGDPNDIRIGCQPPSPNICEDNRGCPEYKICRSNENNIKDCFDVCRSTRCGPNAQCIGRAHQPVCECNPGYSGNPVDFLHGCKPPPRDVCQINADCEINKVCQLTSNGIRDCVNVCQNRKCGPNALCIGRNHQAVCECPTGFGGDANNKVKGCQPHRCETDHDCPDSDICKMSRQGIMECFNACRGKRCGQNAECVATSHQHHCECNPGFEGNADSVQIGCRPRDICKSDSDCRSTEICRTNQRGIKDCIDGCVEVLCGRNAMCTVSDHIALCTCQSGYFGDANNKDLGCTRQPDHICESDHQCPSNAVCRPNNRGIKDCFDGCESVHCGVRAKCITENHQSQCVCVDGFVGNAYDLVKGCELPHECSGDSGCLTDQVCRPGTDGIRRCVSVCLYADCSITAECIGQNHIAVCRCPAGYTGDPIDVQKGCTLIIPNKCEEDRDCDYTHVCRQVPTGILDCVDACSFLQCGPNAECKVQNHHPTCECLPNHKGNPFNLVNGCRPPPKLDECQHDTDCVRTSDVCKPDNSGIMKCVDACNFVSCGANSDCVATNHYHQCVCREGYIKDHNDIMACILKDQDECSTVNECPTFETCKANNIGVLTCAEVCLDLSCSPNANCIALNHKGRCHCEEGFTGDPNSRQGCIPIERHECDISSTCNLHEACLSDREGTRKCTDPCEFTKCGPNAICITLNHKAQCQCPNGLYVGNPFDLEHGCRQVECLSDEHCSDKRYCAPGYNCEDPCVDTCGVNSLCVAQNHKAVCHCRPGFTGEPYTLGCEEIKHCEYHPCHLTAKCVDTPGSYICQCPDTYIGDPYQEGCRHPNSCPKGDIDCPPDAACLPDIGGESMCKNPCDHFVCGSNSLCRVVNHQPRCVCPEGFHGNPNPQDSCIRVSVFCSKSDECGDHQGCVESQCRLFCSKNEECAIGERCIDNHCVQPCFSHADCLQQEACISAGYCHLGCRNNNDCLSSEACIQNTCQNPCTIKGICGTNALCDVRLHNATCKCPPGFEGTPSPILGCKRVVYSCSPHNPCTPGLICVGERCRAPCSECVDGEVCVNGVCMVICSSDGNCPVREVCINQYCQVGCRTDGDCQLNELCTSNRCLCKPGFISTPTGCKDEDECLSHPCHTTAVCVNTPGSFFCRCREGDIGDGYTGCRSPGECPNGNVDCPPNSACGKDEHGIPKCIDPCGEEPCGPHARCLVSNHQFQCSCPKVDLFTGDPYDKHKGCIKVECLRDTDCPTDKQCKDFYCESPCSDVDCGPYGTCVIRDRLALCRCEPGYENNGRLNCVDVNECKQHPCHASAVCENTPGSFSCRCPTGLVGNPLLHPGCHDPNMCPRGDEDCPDTAKCIRINGEPFCKDPCENTLACGRNAECRTVNHEHVCTCPPRYTGNAYYRCDKLECLRNDECRDHEICDQQTYKCIDACKAQTVCGENTICIPQSHSYTCRCKDSYYGDPVAGCRKIISCEVDINCPSGELCQKGVCMVPCNSDRDCGPNDRCDKGRCIAVCRSNNECPQGQACREGTCEIVDRCDNDNKCDDSLACRRGDQGYMDCLDPCALTLCARNSICLSRNHVAVCQCEEGYIGDALNTGCEAVECQKHENCHHNEVCENYKCVDPCKLQNFCGNNAYCVAQAHSAVCRCHEGYEGDPIAGCRLIDYCANNPCHTSALCKIKFGGYECHCPPERNIGNPYSVPGCRGPNECPSGNSDCPPTASCERDDHGLLMCKNLCQKPDICGLNAQCRMENHVAVCYCPPSFTGNPHDHNRGCIRVPEICTTDHDCLGGLVCENRRCRPPCRTDNDCAVRELCRGGHCVLGCKTDSDCLTGEICIANKCIVGCRTDNDCLSTENCLSNSCTSICESATACGTNALCKVLDHRKECYCLPGFTGNPTIACQRVQPKCYSAADCPPNHFCLDGKCRVECVTDKDCIAGERCFSNHCLSLCRRDDDCQSKEICIRNKCQVGCRTNEECMDHLACISNQCIDPCQASATCGPNAECKVINHQSICSCLTGFIGRPNANVGCIRPFITCTVSSDCPAGSGCYNGHCSVTCIGVQDCAVNERCVDGRCRIQCFRDRDCPSEEICEQNVCRVGCRSDEQCPFNEACYNNECINPCSSTAKCGTNALCEVINHEAHCSCPSETTGDPYSECIRVVVYCKADDECGLGRYCEASVCRVTCSSDNNCFDNEKCIERRCSVICTSDRSCPNGFICESGQCIAGCRADSECQFNEECISHQCINPCASPAACGKNAQCQTINHRAVCTCLPDFTGNPRVECSKVDCIIDSDCVQGKICQNYHCIVGCRANQNCPTDKVCVERQCQNPCSFSKICGVGAFCKAENHFPECYCPEGLEGDPHYECREKIEVECEYNSDCPPNHICQNHNCIVKDECHIDPECPQGHICQDKKCFLGCRTDQNCPLDQKCINSQCQNPCHLRRACGENAKCEPMHHRATCTCLPGFSGDPRIRCKEISGICRRDSECPIGQKCIQNSCDFVKGCTSDNDCHQGQICENTDCIYGCRSNSDCSFTRACINLKCVNPCDVDHCGTNAKCTPANHMGICKCPVDYTGDPKRHCTAIPVDCYVNTDCGPEKMCISNKCVVGCQNHNTCPLDKACIHGRCSNPCHVPHSCGIGAICRPNNHQAECTCPTNFKGDSKVRCIPREEDKVQCHEDKDCHVGFVCRNNFCIYEEVGCRTDSACNPGEICENKQCIPGCRQDSDCTFDKACRNSQCINPCISKDSCGHNAVCRPVVHRPHCTCLEGYRGNAYDYCEKIPPKPFVECIADVDCNIGHICESSRCIVGCRTNENCPYDKSCILKQCKNPCDFPDACGKNAECLPVNHKPICSCPAPLTGDPNVKCEEIPSNFCFGDSDCGIGTICENNECIDACRTHDTCPYDKACINRRCQDPCSFYNACGRNAECFPVNHKANCRCPDNFIGDARHECILDRQDERCTSDSECGQNEICESGNCIIGCRNDYQCEPDEACSKRKCQKVCRLSNVCGINAECRGEGHRPICSCVVGFVGDPSVECKIVEQPECRTDTDCPIKHICEYEHCIIGCRTDQNCALNEACINRLCQNPCGQFRACGRNAICKPVNHEAKCACPHNFKGNPNVVCSLEEFKECYVDRDCSIGLMCENHRCIEGCRHDNNCPQDQACISGRCQNPCLLPSSCGTNADCYPWQHRPVCSCPPNYRGDPLISCTLVPSDYCEHDLECPVRKICEHNKCIDGCRTHYSCGFEESCVNKACENPCNIAGVCGQNALCKPLNHDRECICLPGHEGDPRVQCTKLDIQEVCFHDKDCTHGYYCEHTRCIAGCRTNENCPYDQMCHQHVCRNPCEFSAACGRQAMCTPINHHAHCSCPPGYTGDNPQVACELISEPGCRRDSDCAVGQICSKSECIFGCRTHDNCPFDKACINRVCQNPCYVGELCGVNTQCRPINHTGICTCLPGYEGNPRKQCSLTGHQCDTDSDCGSGYVCINHQCKDINECLKDRSPCSYGAICTNTPGSYRCNCPPGFNGDPYKGRCHEIVPGCSHDHDCDDNEACNTLTKECYDVCTKRGICGRGSLCKASNHRHECYCPSGLSGNPYVECSVFETCHSHQECSGNLHCLGSYCGCPQPFKQVGVFCILTSQNCTTTNPCPENQKCIYSGSSTGFCVCPRGFVLMTNGICRDLNECEQTPFPCGHGAQCFNTVGSYRCQCPPGTEGEPNVSGCHRPEGSCLHDSDCPDHLACDTISERCYDPCIVKNPCGRNAECHVKNHVPRCECRAGFSGEPTSGCFFIQGCQSHQSCPGNLFCLPNGYCGCPGEFRRLSDFCILTSINCTTTNPCPENQQCVYVGSDIGFCVCPRGFKLLTTGVCIDIDECSEGGFDICGDGADCRNTLGSYECYCPDGFRGEPYNGICRREDVGCSSDHQCRYNEACDLHTKECYDVCSLKEHCGRNALCRGENHKAKCSCPPGYVGNAYSGCYREEICGRDYSCPGNLICLDSKTCGCPTDYHRVGDYCILTSRNCTTTNPCPSNEECLYTGHQLGFCVCPRGYEIMTNGICKDIDECQLSEHPCAPGAECINLPGSRRCICRAGTIGDAYISGCVEIDKSCRSNEDCPSDKECNVGSGQCINPCYRCGKNAACTVTNHEAICTCPPHTRGDAYDLTFGCYKEIQPTEPPPPPSDLSVVCLADGIQVSIQLDGFNGVIYVKGQSQDPQCRRIVSSSEREVIDFKVLFNTCGLIHLNGEASFILVIQKHPKLVTYRARAYHIKCVYSTGEKTITLGFNVSMITTSGTIANTGPPPTCLMTIISDREEEVSSAEIGENLLLKVEVKPDYIYGGFARSCVAKTMEDNEEIQYEVTDNEGCATEPKIFGNWILNHTDKTLRARFNAFKFPTSNNLRFQCNIRVCFGSCPPINCNGIDAHGRRKRQAENRDLVIGGDNFQEGALREEITVQSNAILTIERRETQVAPTTEGPTIEEIDNVCLPKLGLIISLVITTLLALVAVAVAISCWLMAYRRKSKTSGPLPHPPDFPNPLYTTPEPVAEPSPDYYPSSHRSL